jgi:hypothetical protein
MPKGINGAKILPEALSAFADVQDLVLVNVPEKFLCLCKIFDFY